MTAQEFKELFFPYKLKLYRLAFSLMGQSEDAEDAVQETYVRLWSLKDELAQIANREAYSITLVKNISLDMLRSKKRKGFAVSLEGLSIESDSSADLDSESDLDYVSKWVNNLTVVQKQIFECRHSQGLSIKQISERMGLTQTNVKVILSRLRKQLKEDFTRYEQN